LTKPPPVYSSILGFPASQQRNYTIKFNYSGSWDFPEVLDRREEVGKIPFLQKDEGCFGKVHASAPGQPKNRKEDLKL